MKLSISAVLLATSAVSTNALIGPSSTGRSSTIGAAVNHRNTLSLAMKMNKGQSEVEKLRAAAAKARGEAAKLEKVCFTF